MDTEEFVYREVLRRAALGEAPPARIDPGALLEAVNGDALLAVDIAASITRVRAAVTPRYLAARRRRPPCL